MSDRNYLFQSAHLSDSIAGLRRKLLAAIEALTPNQLLEADVLQVCTHFVSEYTIAPIDLRVEQLVLIEPHEVEIEEFDRGFGQHYKRKYLEFRFEIPFSGDGMLFKLHPSHGTMNPPQAVVDQRKLVLTFLRENRDAESIKRAVDGFISSVQQYLAWQQPEIDAWNQALAALVQQHVATRRNKLVADNQLVAGLGFRVRRRDDPSGSYAVPIHRKPVVPPLPVARPGPAAPPEPIIDAAVYEEILETLAGMSVVMERNPSAFANLDEEAVRTHFLVPLNSNFRGLASGETFNAAGKTDILIKHQDKILFVAECKFWKGAQSLTDAISQLLGYMTWRETKAAILLFNRNRDFTAVLQQIPGVFSQHPQFVRRENYNRQTGFRFVLRHPADAQRFLTVTLLGFDVPTPA